MAYKSISMYRGDTLDLNLAFTGTDGLPLCIKNWSLAFTMKTHYALADSEASLQKFVGTFSDTTSGTSGSATITLNPADTVNLDPLEYDFDIQATTNLGKVYTVVVGKIDLQYDVTRTPGTAGTAA